MNDKREYLNFLIGTIEQDMKAAKEGFEKFIANLEVPLDTRWSYFLKAPSWVKNQTPEARPFNDDYNAWREEVLAKNVDVGCYDW